MDKSSITAINLSKQAKTRLFFLKYGMGFICDQNLRREGKIRIAVKSAYKKCFKKLHT
jgi:hypothetical protein